MNHASFRLPRLRTLAVLFSLFAPLTLRADVSRLKQDKSGTTASPVAANTVTLEKATFAGGCFWCMETPFVKLPGVVEVTVGYTGGRVLNPTYEQVSAGNTGHKEAVEITFDPARVGYAKLLDAFWRSIDPTDPEGQFADKGDQYKTVIYYHSDEQKRLSEKSKAELEKSGRYAHQRIVTEIKKAAKFYPAEEYHQHYYRKNPVHYQLYRQGSGRAPYLEKTWGKTP